MLFLKHCNFTCPGDEGHPPVAPLPPPPAPHLGLPLALLPVPAEHDEEEGGEMGVAHEAVHGQGGVPGLTPEAEEGMEEVVPGGDVTGHHQGPMTETGSERGTEKEDDILHADEPGKSLACPPSTRQLLFYNPYFNYFAFCVRSRSSSRQGGSSRRGGRSSGGHRRGDSCSRSPSRSPSRPNHSPSPAHRGAQASTTVVSDKLRK